MSALPTASIAPLARACILITPSPDADGWHERVNQALAVSDREWDVLVTSDVDQAIRYGADHWAVLMPEFVSGGDVALLNNRTRDISRALAAAADASGIVTVIDDMLLFTHGQVELLPGTRLVTPAATGAVTQLAHLPGPLAFYQTGRPAKGASADWPLDLLHTQATVEQGVSSDLSFDMTGKGRILAWGPHITLSSGLWQMDLEFEVDQRGAKNMLVVDWGPLSAFSRLECCPGQPGIHRATMEHRWENAEVAEFRLALGHGAFSGRITLVSLKVTFISE